MRGSQRREARDEYVRPLQCLEGDNTNDREVPSVHNTGNLSPTLGSISSTICRTVGQSAAEGDDRAPSLEVSQPHDGDGHQSDAVAGADPKVRPRLKPPQRHDVRRRDPAVVSIPLVVLLW
jgi:hypothetical protein